MYPNTFLNAANQVGARVQGWPCEGTITQVFGQRSVTGSRHGGMDIGANTGTPVYAPAAARVHGVYPANLGYDFGAWVCLDYEDTQYYGAFAHLSRIDVGPGQMVNEGDQIGLVGSTGVSTGAHLHWAQGTNPMFSLDFSQLTDPAIFVDEREDEPMTPDEAARLALVENMLFGWGIPAVKYPNVEDLFPASVDTVPEGQEPAADEWHILTGDNAREYVSRRGFAFGLSLLNHELNHPEASDGPPLVFNAPGAPAEGESDDEATP